MTLYGLCFQRYAEGVGSEEVELYVDVKPVVMVGLDKVSRAQR